MYIPAAHAWTDLASILACCRAHPFATVIAVDDGEPEAQHLPLLTDHAEGRFVLYGHAAVGDPVWRAARAMAVFHGPHAYISAAWYEEPNTVPTWNYLAVHLTGSLHVIDDPETSAALFARLAASVGDADAHVWQRRLDAPTTAKLTAMIRWFRIDVDHVQAKAKLSQHHSPERRRRVIARLMASPEPAAPAVGEAMAETLASGPP